jgi:two-component system, sensor histidine kinase and response regulator
MSQVPPEDSSLAIDLRAHLAAIVDSSDDAILSKDLDGTILSWNRGAERLYGYRAEEVVGRSIAVLIPDDRPGEVGAILQRIRRGEVVDHFETVRVRADGVRFPVSLTVSPVRDVEGRIVAASAIARDISVRVRAAAEAARLRGILDAASDAFVGMDVEGLITDWNPAAEQLFGWSASEAIGRRLSDTILPARLRASHEEGLRRYLATGQGRILGRCVELPAVHRDGHELTIELSAFATTVDDQVAFNAFLHDVTEHKRLTAELEAARDDALEASRLKSDFLATMSHEIRTPMNGVIGMAGLLLDTELDPEQREYAETVRSSGDALLSIINDILDFSKIEAGKLDLEIVDVDLRTLVEEVADLLAPWAHEKGLELATLVRPDVPPAVRGDPGRLRQILLNLMSNAVKFTDAGEVVVHATASDPDGEAVAVHFEVRDTGVGIAGEDRDRLFDPFTQADASTTRTYGGTGLGLAICKRLIDLFGGELTLESEPGRGSTFAFTVQLELGDVAPAPPPPRADTAGLRLLIVDDNATNRRILQQQARTWGMTSVLADGAPAALDHLRSESPGFDAALLDMDMPGTDGVELTRVLRGDPTTADLPVVLLTSSGVRGSGEAARQAGVSAYLTKPVHQQQLFDTIAAVLGAGAVPTTPVTHTSLARDRARVRPAVLVAEDNPANQKVATAMLARIGYRADVVATGAEAVEAVDRIDYGAVLMDVQMPEMDGYQATAEIRRRGRNVPIIAVTAGAMAGERERCLAAGMDDYLTKPVAVEEVAEVLDRWVQGAQGAADPQADLGAGASEVAHRGEGGVPQPADGTDVALDPATVEMLRDVLSTEPGGFEGMLASFLDRTGGALVTVGAALRGGDTEAAGRELHAIAGAAGTLGAHRLAALCRGMEERLLSGTQTPDGAALTSLRVELDRVAAWLREQPAP